MRRRFFALGYLFFVLLTVTGLIMIFAFIERLATKPILTTSDLVENALSDSTNIKEDFAYVIENVGNDLQASLKNFHYYPTVAFVDNKFRSSCLGCHTPLPHNREEKLRAFLNMHGGYVACQTCHWVKPATEYRWYDVERKAFAAILPEKRPVMSILLVGVNQDQAYFERRSDQSFSSKYTESVQSSFELKNQLCESNYRDDLKSTLSCDNCHTSKNASIDWGRLGYTDARALELATLSTPSVYQKYDEFYIPSF